MRKVVRPMLRRKGADVLQRKSNSVSPLSQGSHILSSSKQDVFNTPLSAFCELDHNPGERGKPNRFGSATHLCAYARLVPRAADAADRLSSSFVDTVNFY